MFVKEVSARVVKDSRGEDTIEVSLETYHGSFSASAPSGKSKGKHEVPSYHEKGLGFSVRMLNAIGKKMQNKNLMIKNIDSLKELKNFVGRYEGKYGRLGGNTHYALQTVFLKAASKELKKELWEFIFDDLNLNSKTKKPKMPMPVGNCIGGGLHSSFDKKEKNKKRPDFQEFLLIPNEKNFSKAVTKLVHGYEYAGKKIGKEHGFLRKLKKKKDKINDEGAWKTSLSNTNVLKILEEVGKKFNVRIGLDVAASSFYEFGYYDYKNKELTRDKVDQAEYMERLIKDYGLYYVEDPMQEEDFGGFVEIMNAVNKKRNNSLIVGDDLTTTNPSRVKRAVKDGAINALIVKPNQIGDLIDVKKVCMFCKENNVKIIFSHRSGETMDDALGDFAVGFQADFIKCGIQGRERLIKLKRVMDIEKSLR